jgi:hypothetical protein
MSKPSASHAMKLISAYFRDCADREKAVERKAGRPARSASYEGYLKLCEAVTEGLKADKPKRSLKAPAPKPPKDELVEGDCKGYNYHVYALGASRCTMCGKVRYA